MGKERKYNIGRNLSLLYSLYALVSFFFNISILGTLFLSIIFPLILVYLNKLLNKEYLYFHKRIFIITIIIMIISSLAPIIGVAVLSTIVDLSALSSLPSGNISNKNIVVIFANSTSILLLARGIALLTLSILLINKFREFRTSLNVASLSLGLLGMHTIITSMIGLFPRLLYILPYKVSMSIMTILMPIIFCFLFLSLFWEFKSGRLTNNEEPIEIS